MKTTLLMLIALSAFASGETLPPDAEALKAKRDNKVAEIDRIYVAELEKLQKKHMKDGALDAATRIENEIKRVMPDPFVEEDVFSETVWAWGSGGELSLKKGGKAAHSKWDGSGKWKLVGKEIVVTSPQGQDFRVLFREDGTGVVSSAGGASTTLKKLN